MELDLPTLMIAGSFVSAVSGMFLVFSWLQSDRKNGLLWWASAVMLLAVAIPMVAGTRAAAGTPAFIVAITLLNISPAMIWASARATNARSVNYAIVGSGAALWLVAYAMPVIREAPAAQTGLNLVIVSVFLFAAAYEFWRGRAERLTARWPLVALLVLHGGFSTVGALYSMSGGFDPIVVGSLHGWITFVHFETLAFVVGTSIFAVAMARERSEMIHKIAASVDTLTGVATRRVFYERGEIMLSGAQEDDAAFAIILFDLDGFKAINDTYGHGPGDQVLRLFGDAAMKTLRGSDMIGRLGGEEFGALLPGASIGAAYVAAERIRVAFASACRQMGDKAINATVSAGIAQAHSNSTLDALIQAADLALYRAKIQGRDRVEVEAGEDRKQIDNAVAPAIARKVA
ncbi:MAG: GGDEF domain-containing protein [Dongiaceae bacterium]